MNDFFLTQAEKKYTVMLSTEIFEVSKFILPLDPAEHK
jgi:hypothetical protein